MAWNKTFFEELTFHFFVQSTHFKTDSKEKKNITYYGLIVTMDRIIETMDRYH